MTEIVYNIIDWSVGSKYGPHHAEGHDGNVLANPDWPRETPEPVKLVPDSPEDQDGEERGEDESQGTAGNGADQRNEVVKVRHRQSYTSCS